MDELKRLLRRLDGLDGSKSLAKSAPEAEAEQRGYVGALRGVPVHNDHGPVSVAALPAQKGGSNAAIFVAAVVAAALSTATVYLVMSGQGVSSQQGVAPVPASERVVPSRLEYKPVEPGSPSQRQSTDTPEGLVRRAEQLLEGGHINAARTLLQQAAELGSGTAALKLGRSYDPTQIEALRYADNQTNPALAKAWYERALALGTREAASYIADTGAR
ncbi:hypothetical protein [Hyphomicrobium sp.]|uniref:hypothetical protein n=1 Tax=Hyphomicrobium sp. TaxID=82 RepID=UPI0025BE1C92|nr:hypothetical protein [Hyphomicrobium sp.]MCC7251780.1 hypothetical protein [Hyphomicrobium sp.]